jgi:hypothetical protein
MKSKDGDRTKSIVNVLSMTVSNEPAEKYLLTLIFMESLVFLFEKVVIHNERAIIK